MATGMTEERRWQGTLNIVDAAVSYLTTALLGPRIPENWPLHEARHKFLYKQKAGGTKRAQERETDVNMKGNHSRRWKQQQTRYVGFSERNI